MYQTQPCYVARTFSSPTHSTSQNHRSSRSQYPLPSNSINHDQNGKMTHLSQHGHLPPMLLPAAHRYLLQNALHCSSAAMLATCKDLVHPTKALKSAQRPKLTHRHALVVTWGNHWSLQLFSEGDGFQRQPVDWLLPSRPSSPQQTLQVGRG